MTIPARKPSKPWRVYGARGISEDYRSERSAYEAVSSIVGQGVTAKVYHWENGGWHRYEVIEPTAPKDQPAADAASCPSCSRGEDGGGYSCGCPAACGARYCQHPTETTEETGP